MHGNFERRWIETFFIDSFRINLIETMVYLDLLIEQTKSCVYFLKQQPKKENQKHSLFLTWNFAV